MELAFLSATEQARLVRAGEVSSVELVQLYLDRIERLDPELNAYVTVRGDEALADARACDEDGDDAPFRGVPIALKDLAATKGIRTTYSCRAFADNVPDFDTAVVRRVREAGFVIVGKDEHAGVRDGRVHRVRAQRRHAEPLGPEPHAGWVERRRSGRPRRGPHSARARDRRRRLDPDPGVVLRGLRPQAVPRPRLAGAVPLPRGPLDGRPDLEIRRGRGAVPRRARRLRAGRSLVGAAARAPVRGRGRRGAGTAPDRRRGRAADRHAGASGLHGRAAVGRGAARGSRSRARRGEPAVGGGRRADRLVHRHLAGQPHALPDRPGSPHAAQPRARRSRADDYGGGVRERGDAAPGGRSPDRRVLERRRRRPHADARASSGPDRLAARGGRRRARATPAEHRLHAVHSRRQPHRPSGDVAAAPPATRRGCRSACRRSGRRPARRSSSGWHRSSRPPARGARAAPRSRSHKKRRPDRSRARHGRPFSSEPNALRASVKRRG